jgi:predicted homoserine dehydrogenase-like protein
MAHHVKLVNDVPEGGIVGWDDVEIDTSLDVALKLRRETEALVLEAVPAP